MISRVRPEKSTIQQATVFPLPVRPGPGVQCLHTTLPGLEGLRGSLSSLPRPAKAPLPSTEVEKQVDSELAEELMVLVNLKKDFCWENVFFKNVFPHLVPVPLPRQKDPPALPSVGAS